MFLHVLEFKKFRNICVLFQNSEFLLFAGIVPVKNIDNLLLVSTFRFPKLSKMDGLAYFILMQLSVHYRAPIPRFTRPVSTSDINIDPNRFRFRLKI